MIRMNDKTIQDIEQLSEESMKLWNTVEELGEKYFGDMLFERGSTTSTFLECEYQGRNCLASLPPVLEYFSYEWFDFTVRSLPDNVGGHFDDTDGKQELCVIISHKDDENVILHELIHLHEAVLSSVPFCRDLVFLSLYWDLKEKVSDLDTIIKGFGNVWNETSLYDDGGEHSVLFLLKSLDLDLRKGQKLGTIFGYDLMKKLEHSQN